MKFISKYKGNMSVDEVEYVINTLKLTGSQRSSAYQYFLHGLNLDKLDLHNADCPEFLIKCEKCHATRASRGILRKWLYGIEA